MPFLLPNQQRQSIEGTVCYFLSCQHPPLSFYRPDALPAKALKANAISAVDTCLPVVHTYQEIVETRTASVQSCHPRRHFLVVGRAQRTRRVVARTLDSDGLHHHQVALSQRQLCQVAPVHNTQQSLVALARLRRVQRWSAPRF